MILAERAEEKGKKVEHPNQSQSVEVRNQMNPVVNAVVSCKR